jgi:glutathione S-transferase
MTMFELYWAKNTGAMAPHLLLELAKAPYRLHVVDTAGGEHLTEAYKTVNPLGQVPVLKLPEGSVMTESAAMLLHLAERFPDTGLLPPQASVARAQVQRWLLFMAVNVYETDLRVYYSDRYTTDPAGADAVRDAANAALARQWAILEAALQPGPFLLGAQRTIADLYLLMLSGWTDLTATLPNVQRAKATLLADPIIRQVWEQHTQD